MTTISSSQRSIAASLFVLLFLIYNANGREMGTYDSQPTKFAARELALYGRLTLDRVVARTPEYGNRAGFQRDRHGHFRSAYSVVPSILAAVPASLLHVTGLVDLRAPLAPNLIAKLTASALTAAAVTLTFVALATVFGTSAALWVAVGLGLGTNFWPLGSGTLWQLETVAFGLGLGLVRWFRRAESLSLLAVTSGAAGLALAAATRPQVAPLVGVLIAGLIVRVGWRRALPAVAVVGGAAAAVVVSNVYWFGGVLGGAHALQQASLALHDVTGNVSESPWQAALGLLVSPNRGLLVFSPVAIVALVGIPMLRHAAPSRGGGWWLAAALLQSAGYACYSVWWGGHTYGPRYLMDVMIPLAPAAAAAVAWVRARNWRKALALALLAFSIAVSAAGAFVYPADGWNQDPDVDRNHQRLWDWRDTQIGRCLGAGLSPQNFSLFDRAAVRNPTGVGSRP